MRIIWFKGTEVGRVISNNVEEADAAHQRLHSAQLAAASGYIIYYSIA